MCNKLIVDPNRCLLEHINDLIEKSNYHENIYIKLLSEDFDIQSNKCIKKIDNIEKLKTEKIDVLCCSEEAIYWLVNNYSKNWILRFNPSYLSLVEKINFKNYAIDQNLPICKFWLDKKNITVFPVIAKPSVGFASIGVDKLNNYSSCEEYEKNFHINIKNSVIEHYRLKYFPEIKNNIIFEEEIVGNFFRTSFIVKDNHIFDVYPIQGLSQSKSAKRQYSWVEFEYTPANYLNNKKLTSFITKLIECFLLKDGVYIVEYITTESGDIKLLEFSPRITSQRLIDLIKYATNIDLNYVMLCCFLNFPFSLNSKKDFTVRLQIGRKGENLLPPSDYSNLTTNKQISAHKDLIDCKYYIKER